jgi:hypothetical protein
MGSWARFLSALSTTPPALATRMKLPNLPRWTVYPAVAVLFGILVMAVPKGPVESSNGAALELRGQRSARTPVAPDELRPEVPVLGPSAER